VLTGVHGKNLHDLLPIPYTSERIDHVVSRVQAGAGFLGRAIVLGKRLDLCRSSNNSEMDGMGIFVRTVAPFRMLACCSHQPTSMSAPSTTATIR